MYTELLEGGKKIIQPVGRKVDGYLTAKEQQHIRGQYAGLCTITDYWIGDFLNYLRQQGYYDDSLIIFVSDHGEPLGTEEWGHGIMRKCRPWPYEKLAHIPLMVRHPEFGQGEQVSSMVQTCDITPTVLDYLGLSRWEGMHGESLLPLMNNEISQVREFAIAAYHKASWSIRTDSWSYITWRPGRTGRMFLIGH